MGMAAVDGSGGTGSLQGVHDQKGTGDDQDHVDGAEHAIERAGSQRAQLHIKEEDAHNKGDAPGTIRLHLAGQLNTIIRTRVARMGRNAINANISTSKLFIFAKTATFIIIPKIRLYSIKLSGYSAKKRIRTFSAPRPLIHAISRFLPYHPHPFSGIFTFYLPYFLTFSIFSCILRLWVV